MTADSPDIGDDTSTLRKTPSRELVLEFPPTQATTANNTHISHGGHEHSETSANAPAEPDPEEGAGQLCGYCVRDGQFTTFDALFIIGGMIMYVADIITDLVVGVQYFRGDQVLWGIMTFIFVLVPSLVLQYFSFRWFVSDLHEDPDHKKKGFLHRIWSWCQWLATHVLQLGALTRYWRTLKFGLKSRTDPGYYRLMVYEYRDITMLRLLEAFMESAPQLVLQVYIMVETEDLYWLTAVSACVSLASLSWALEAYHKALRDSRPDKANISYYGVSLRILWRLLTITARVIAMALFAAIYEWWVFVVAGAHWALMTTWLVWQDTEFCDTRFEEVLFDAVMGVIHIFCFFNMKEGRTRYRALLFYTVIFVENTVMFGLWYRVQESREEMYGLPALVFVWGGFFLGIFIMSCYYRLCHPTGQLPFCVCGEPDAAEHTGPSVHEDDAGSSSENSARALAGGAGGDEVDGVAVVVVRERQSDTRQAPRQRVNLFTHAGRRTIHPELMRESSQTRCFEGVVVSPPRSTLNGPSPFPTDGSDLHAVYSVEKGTVATHTGAGEDHAL